MTEELKRIGWDMDNLAEQLFKEKITQSYYRQESRKLATEYANQRVIEELMMLRDTYVKMGKGILFIKRIDRKINELKQ